MTTEKDDVDVFFGKLFDAFERLKNHLTKIVKSREIIVTGDMDHYSIQHIIGVVFKNIDNKKKYDWQDDNVHEEQFLRNINWIMGETPWSALSTVGSEANLDSAILNAISGKEALTLRPSREYKCYDCCANLTITFNGNGIHIGADKPCAHNRGYTVEVDFPTGIVVYDDWPARFSELKKAGLIDHEEDYKQEHSVNYISGKRHSSEIFAKQNILHMFVGNSSPNVCYSAKNAELRIGNYKRECEQPNGYYVERVTPEFKGFRSLGSVCTDLWWTTLIDKQYYDALVAQLPDPTNDPYMKKVETIKIKPGRYRFTAHHGMDPLTEDYNDVNLFIVGEYIGPCK